VTPVPTSALDEEIRPGDVLGGGARALRQRAHFRGHHGKALAGIAGARRLHRRVQRQQIGLEGDVVDHPDDVGDLLRGALDARHRVDRLGRDRAALCAACIASVAIAAACFEAWAEAFTEAASSSVVAAVSSSEEACSSVRFDRSSAPMLISRAASPTSPRSPGSCFEPSHREPVFLEDLDRTRHGADLVPACLAVDGDAVVARSQAIHPRLQLIERPGDRATGEQHRADKAEQHSRHRQGENELMEALRLGVEDHRRSLRIGFDRTVQLDRICDDLAEQTIELRHHRQGRQVFIPGRLRHDIVDLRLRLRDPAGQGVEFGMHLGEADLGIDKLLQRLVEALANILDARRVLLHVFGIGDRLVEMAQDVAGGQRRLSRVEDRRGALVDQLGIAVLDAGIFAPCIDRSCNADQSDHHQRDRDLGPDPEITEAQRKLHVRHAHDVERRRTWQCYPQGNFEQNGEFCVRKPLETPENDGSSRLMPHLSASA
jgi:hypothetical protein